MRVPLMKRALLWPLLEYMRNLRDAVAIAQVEAMCVGASTARSYSNDGSAVLPAPGFRVLAEPQPEPLIAKAFLHHKPANQGERGRLETMLD